MTQQSVCPKSLLGLGFHIFARFAAIEGKPGGAVCVRCGHEVLDVIVDSYDSSLVERAWKLLREIVFEDYCFEVREGHGGVFLQASYSEADTYGGHQEIQKTRKWLLSPGMTDSEIVQTAFKCVLTSMEHRAREHFTYKGARVFAPHYDVEDLVALCRAGKERAGGRP